MALRKPRASNFKLENNRRQIAYECLMADLNLMGIVNDANYEKYTWHEKSPLIKEPEVPSGGGGSGGGGSGGGGSGGGAVIPPIVPGTTANVTVDINAIDENALSAALSGKETWIILAFVSTDNNNTASKNLKKLINFLATRKQAENRIQIELRANVVGGELRILASCFTPIKDELTEITFPTDGSVTEIGAGAFEGCKNLINLTISVESIGQRAFAYCRNLTDVHFLRSVRSIKKGVFKGCTGLQSVTFDHRNYLVGGEQVDMGESNFLNAGNFTSTWLDKDIVRKD